MLRKALVLRGNKWMRTYTLGILWTSALVGCRFISLEKQNFILSCTVVLHTV